MRSRSLLLTTVAMTALLTGVVVVGAQQSPGDRKDPSATEQKQQQPPRGQNKVKEWPGSQVQHEQKGSAQQEQKARPQSERSTTGQGSDRSAEQPRMRERSTTGQSQEPAKSQDKPTTGQSQQERSTTSQSTTSQPQQRPATGTTQSRDRSGASVQSQTTQRGAVQLSDEQRTRIATRFSERLDRRNVRPLSRSQISVSVGATLSRSVRFYAVPRDVVTIYPQFRNHQFVVVEDEIVIVEPRSRRVVALLPMSGERRAARASTRETIGTAPAGARPRLTPQVREEIRTIVMREPACRLEQRIEFALFIPIPRTVQVCELPAQVVTGTPELSRYRYVVRGDEIALVDPDEYRVIEVIR